MNSSKQSLRLQLINYIKKYIDDSEMTQSEAAVMFGVAQPRMSDLMRSKVHLFSIDTLTAMLIHAGFRVNIVCEKDQCINCMEENQF